jgi:predicted ATP-dependent endonuclease of OLD family
MDGNVSIQYLKSQRDQNKQTDSEKTFLSLLSLAGSKLEEFDDQQKYERLIAKLEAVSNKISDEIFKYWSQNNQLEIEFLTSQGNNTEKPPLNSGTILHVRIYNQRHRVSVPFDQRSKGFVWFFSFFAYFSQYENKGKNLILLLDEPGLSLHAAAQHDFLRFIDDRLAKKYQVIYTTHSPFMIDATKLDRVRTVEDDEEKGSVISGEVLRKDENTTYPLQAALGYELAQTLFIGPNNLLVEGPSDLLFLQVLNEAVKNKYGIGLDPHWVIVPVGGADKIPTFISLLKGNKLNVAVLIDISDKDKQRIESLQANALLSRNCLIKVSEITGTKAADIEDIFNPKFYIKLVNLTYNGKLSSEIPQEIESNGNPRIVKRINAYIKEQNITGGPYNHYDPALYLLSNQEKLIKEIDDDTIGRAKELFEKINKLIKL